MTKTKRHLKSYFPAVIQFWHDKGCKVQTVPVVTVKRLFEFVMQLLITFLPSLIKLWSWFDFYEIHSCVWLLFLLLQNASISISFHIQCKNLPTNSTMSCKISRKGSHEVFDFRGLIKLIFTLSLFKIKSCLISSKVDQICILTFLIVLNGTFFLSHLKST